MVSDAQKRATKKWADKNKEKRKYIVTKSQAKKFVKIGTDEDLQDLAKLIEKKLKK